MAFGIAESGDEIANHGTSSIEPLNQTGKSIRIVGIPLRGNFSGELPQVKAPDLFNEGKGRFKSEPADDLPIDVLVFISSVVRVRFGLAACAGCAATGLSSV